MTKKKIPHQRAAEEQAAGLGAQVLQTWLADENNLDEVARNSGLDPDEYQLLKGEMEKLIGHLKTFAGVGR